jgi:excisionase family DNA binding protein
LIYTVDEVSELLDIPRPTLYRYLREYSIPHVRRSGKISIPEESFDRIKEARELHREGLGTASVKRRLREGNDPVDAEELMERLDRISGALEGLQGDLRPANGASSSSQETLRTVLKKQEMLMSAVSSLTEKMESLFSANDRSRTVPPDSLEAYEEESFFERPERLQEARENTRRTRSTQDSGDWTVASNGTTGVMVDEPVAEVATDEAAAGALEDDATTRIIPGPAYLLDVPERREKFGALARRRRKGILALLLLALLVGAVLAWGLYGSGEEVEQSAASDEQSVEEDSQSVPEAVEEASPVSPTAEVPDLIDMTLPEAEDEIAGAGLELGAWNEIPEYEVPAGRVVVQGPEAGEEVDPDTPVDLIVSAGPPVYGPEVPVDGVGGGVGNGQYPGVNPLPPNEAAVFPPGPL